MSTELSTVERLKLYTDRVNELLQRRFVRSGMNSQYSMKWDANSQSLKFQAMEPDEEDLRSFLLLFRQFISTKEPVFINRIFNDCIRFLNDDHLKEQVTKAQDEWKRIFQRMGDIRIIVDNKYLSPEYVLDLWINGHYFHNNPGKAAELNHLMKDQIPFVRMQLVAALPSLTNVLVYIAKVVAYGLEHDSFHIPPESA